MSESKIPGSMAKHAIISDDCRTNRTDAGALDEAFDRVREEYFRCAAGWPIGKGAKFHIALTIERPTP